MTKLDQDRLYPIPIRKKASDFSEADSPSIDCGATDTKLLL
jgi:hypothetical protein